MMLGHWETRISPRPGGIRVAHELKPIDDQEIDWAVSKTVN